MRNYFVRHKYVKRSFLCKINQEYKNYNSPKNLYEDFRKEITRSVLKNNSTQNMTTIKSIKKKKKRIV